MRRNLVFGCGFAYGVVVAGTHLQWWWLMAVAFTLVVLIKIIDVRVKA